MEILITGLRAQPGLIEVRGKSPETCSEGIVSVSVTIAGETDPAYQGGGFVTDLPSAGYRPWTAFATITPAYAATGRPNPPCDADLIVEALQGSCATKAAPEPVTLRCCATIEDLTAQLSPCAADRTRTITAAFRIRRQHEPGEITVFAHLTSTDADAFIPEAQTRTLALDHETQTYTVVFVVETPAETETVSYTCMVERVTAGKCHDETVASATVEVQGCPCFAEPAELTVHTVEAPYDALPASERDGVPCYTVEKVRVRA